MVSNQEYLVENERKKREAIGRDSIVKGAITKEAITRQSAISQLVRGSVASERVTNYLAQFDNTLTYRRE